VADVTALVVGFFIALFASFLASSRFSQSRKYFSALRALAFLRFSSEASELEEESKLSTEPSSAPLLSDDDEEDDEEISIIEESSPERLDFFFFDFFALAAYASYLRFELPQTCGKEPSVEMP
jgi:hypothetical protein